MSHNNTLNTLDAGWCAVYTRLDKGRCVTLHDMTIHCNERWYLVCAAGAGTTVLMFFWFLHCFCGLKVLWVDSCMRSCRVIWNLGLQIAVEWLHECCHVVLSCVKKDARLRRDVAKCIVLAAYVILLSFAAEHCKSCWNGRMKVAMLVFH